MRALIALVLAGLLPAAAADTQRIGGVDTSAWRGFNLLEKFTLRGNARYREEDFRWIAELGFNFVRLPIDYRIYTEPGDWRAFREDALREIDEAVDYGRRHGIHVCLNLHRAPGFCINPPAEPKDLWTDPDALEAFVAHWVMFARRYRDVPPGQLSFNLLNEPIGTTHENYLRVMTRALDAIRAVDTGRLVIVDGNGAGREPVPDLLDYAHVIQATRGYHPATISHYRASWARGSDTWPVPTWPPTGLNGHLYGPAKPDYRAPLVLRGTFAAGTEIALPLAQLSSRVRLQARAAGKVVAEAAYDPRQQPDDWKPLPSDAAWVFHAPTHPLQFRFLLEAPADEIAIEAVDGDWIRFSELRLQPPGQPRRVWGADPAWGVRPQAHTVSADGRLVPASGARAQQPLLDYLEPWRDIAARGATVFVGEWGCYNRTPHAVALAWMKSWLEQWQETRFGWALWNFRGPFGILDSGRADVIYEDWHGHALDREMLSLLQRARPPPR